MVKVRIITINGIGNQVLVIGIEFFMTFDLLQTIIGAAIQFPIPHELNSLLLLINHNYAILYR